MSERHERYKDYIKQNKSFLFRRTFRIVGIPVIGIFIYLIIAVINPSEEKTYILNWPHIITDLVLAIVIAILIWEGNLLINSRIDRYFDWRTQTVKRLAYQIVLNTFYSILVVVGCVIIYLQFVIHYSIPAAIPVIKLTTFISIILLMLMNAIYIGIYFFRQWEKSQFESEDMKRRHLQLQLEALKNQVNPHFLFNSLNALTTLIHEDQNLAVDFVQRIASVYRYVLQSKDRQLVELREEINFINAFFFLQRIRFGENLRTSINIPENCYSFYIAPLTIQMLVENAIKHNVISSEKPLHIEIYAESECILAVKNNLQKKLTSKNSMGIGLANITKQYEILGSSKKVEILNSDSCFVVKIPLFKEKKKYESTNY